MSSDPTKPDEDWKTEDGSECEGEEYEEEEEEDVSLANPDVVLKYRTAGRFANQVITETAAKCVPGANVYQLCSDADARIRELAGTAFSKDAQRRKIPMGIGFPTCISVNNIVCHYSPSFDDQLALSAGDVVRIDLGVNVCGFMSQAATTIIVGGTEALPSVLRTKADDVFAAARTAHEAAARLMRPGNTNHMVTDVLEGVADAYGVTACEGVLSHRMEYGDPEAAQVIIQRRVPGSDPPQKVDTVTFETGQIWQLDVLYSSGSGRLRLGDAVPTIFRRGFTRDHMRMRSAREVLAVSAQQSGPYAFGMRQMASVKAAGFGVSECVKAGVLTPYTVLYERGAEVVVHLKATVLILPKEIARVAFVGLPADVGAGDSKPLPEVAAEALKRGLTLGGKKKSGAAKKAKKAAAAESK